jgi:hypothetical protein
MVANPRPRAKQVLRFETGSLAFYMALSRTDMMTTAATIVATT